VFNTYHSFTNLASRDSQFGRKAQSTPHAENPRADKIRAVAYGIIKVFKQDGMPEGDKVQPENNVLTGPWCRKIFLNHY